MIPFRFAPLHLFCIPAYAHQIPTGFFQSLLNYHRDNLYIISFFYRCGDYFVEVVGWVRIDWVRSVMVCQLKSERS